VNSIDFSGSFSDASVTENQHVSRRFEVWNNLRTFKPSFITDL